MTSTEQSQPGESAEQIELTWTVVFDTPSTETALKLLGRVVSRIGPVRAVSLGVWGEQRNRRAAVFVTHCGDMARRPDMVAAIMDLAARISATWTLDLAEDSPQRVLFQGWTPLEYRRFTLSGIEAVSFIARRGAGGVSETVETGRLVALRDGTVVQILDG